MATSSWRKALPHLRNGNRGRHDIVEATPHSKATTDHRRGWPIRVRRKYRLTESAPDGIRGGVLRRMPRRERAPSISAWAPRVAAVWCQESATSRSGCSELDRSGSANQDAGAEGQCDASRSAGSDSSIQRRRTHGVQTTDEELRRGLELSWKRARPSSGTQAARGDDRRRPRGSRPPTTRGHRRPPVSQQADRAVRLSPNCPQTARGGAPGVRDRGPERLAINRGIRCESTTCRR